LRTLAQAREELGRAPGKGETWNSVSAEAGSDPAGPDLMASVARIAIVRTLKPSIARRRTEAHPKAA
jgi:hypothetical protein